MTFPVGEQRWPSATADVVLVSRLAAGDAGAMTDVYRRHVHAVEAGIRLVVFDRTLCEDVVQDVFVTLWRHPDRFAAGRGTLRTYPDGRRPEPGQRRDPGGPSPCSPGGPAVAGGSIGAEAPPGGRGCCLAGRRYG